MKRKNKKDLMIEILWVLLEYYQTLAKANRIELKYYRGLVNECRTKKIDNKENEK